MQIGQMQMLGQLFVSKNKKYELWDTWGTEDYIQLKKALYIYVEQGGEYMYTLRTNEVNVACAPPLN